MLFEPSAQLIVCGDESIDIRRLLSDVAALKNSIESIKSALLSHQAAPDFPRPARLSEKLSKSPILLDRAKREIWEIRERRKICSDLVRSSIAWDMMLELYVAALHGRKLRTKNLLLATIAPETTALRWIMFLEERGYIVRTAFPAGGRGCGVNMN